MFYHYYCHCDYNTELFYFLFVLKIVNQNSYFNKNITQPFTAKHLAYTLS